MTAFFRNLPGAVGGILADILLVGLPLLPIAAYAADRETVVAGGGVAMFIAIAVFCFLIYFLPAIVAAKRGVTASGWVFLINLLFGWTVVGWWGCLIWGAFGQTRAQKAFYERALRS